MPARFAPRCDGGYNWAGTGMDEKTAYLALGSNLGDRAANLRAAVDLLESGGDCHITVASSVYDAKPVGLLDQPDFLNAVIRVETDLDPVDLLNLCIETEKRMGRERTIRWGPRVIDIDILWYDGQEVQAPGLTIPHPRMMERAFVLAPLAEVAPDLELPGGILAREAAARVEQKGIKRTNESIWSR